MQPKCGDDADNCARRATDQRAGCCSTNNGAKASSYAATRCADDCADGRRGRQTDYRPGRAADRRGQARRGRARLG